jgi:hypothetical protein
MQVLATPIPVPTTLLLAGSGLLSPPRQRWRKKLQVRKQAYLFGTAPPGGMPLFFHHFLSANLPDASN